MGTVTNIDDTPGFWASGYSPSTTGIKPSAGYGTVLQVSTTKESPMTGAQTWLFQIAHAHAVDRPQWRKQTNNGGWTPWKQLAFLEDIPNMSGYLRNTGDQTLTNGRFYLNGSAPEHVLMFQGNGVSTGYIGFGAYPKKDFHVFNYGTNKYINIAADGKLYYDGKEIATVDKIPTSLPASDVSSWAKAVTKPTYTMDEIGDAIAQWVNVGTLTRKVIVANAKTGNGYISRVALGLTNPMSQFSPAILSVGTNDEGTSWLDWTFWQSGDITNPSGRRFAYVDEVVTLSTSQTITGSKTFTQYCDFRGGAGNSGSDMRFKEEVCPVEEVLPDLLDLKVIRYVWNKEGEEKRDTFGISATELEEKGGVFEKMVHERGDEQQTKWVEYDRVGVLALKGMQEMHHRWETEKRELNRELADLKQELAELRGMLLQAKK